MAAGSIGHNPVTMSALAANGKKGWFGWPENADYEKLRERLGGGADRGRTRRRSRRRCRTIAWDFVPMMMLGSWTQPAAMRKNIDGFLTNPDVMPFWNVTKT